MRREARRALNQRKLRHADSGAVCQSVFRQMLEKMKEDKIVLDNPLELLGLLKAMVRNKVADQVAYERAERRDMRRLSETRVEELELTSKERDPAEEVADNEFFETLLNEMDPRDAQAFRDQLSGESWATVAGQTGDSADALRMRIMRNLERFRRALNAE